MGLRTALVLTVVVLISCSQGKRIHKKIATPSLRMAHGEKSMEVVNKQAAYLSKKDKYVTKGPPCDKKFSWTYVRPGSSMKIRSRWLGKAMNYPDNCGWSFWTGPGMKLSIMCDYIDIRDTDYLLAYDYHSAAEIGWQGEQVSNLDVTAAFMSTEMAFGLESNQVRQDKRSFECTVTGINWCVEGQFQCQGGTYKCIPLSKVCDLVKDCDDGEDELDDCANSPPCPEGLFRCNNGQCVDPFYNCVNFNKCYVLSGSELCIDNDCDPMGDFVCKDMTCINGGEKCRGTTLCPDGSDEESCNPVPVPCPDGHIRCGFWCLPPHAECDGNRQCSDDDENEELDCFFDRT